MSEQEKQAWITSLRLLAATPKSRKLLERKLSEKGFPGAVVKETLDRLEAQGIVNDRAFAESLFEAFTAQRLLGRKRIVFEMEKRGLRADLIQTLLERYRPDEERSKAHQLAAQKKERWKSLEPRKRWKRLYDFLVRRGFDFALAREVVEEIESEGG